MSRIMRKTTLVLAAMLATTQASAAPVGKYAGKKIMFIDSYHEGYEWSDGIVDGVQTVLKGSGAELKIFRMDTKRNTTESYKQQVARKAKQEIEAYAPDVIIACDDNASKYIIRPFYKDAKIPVVFCGLNWDASGYGYPYKNATGMVEVSLIQPLIDNLRAYAKGKRIGFLSADNETERKEATYYKKAFKSDLAAEAFAKTFADWKRAYGKLQGEADMLILTNHAGIEGWDDKEAESFVLENTKIPSGSSHDFMAPFVMVVLAKVPQEQGIWSTKTALRIIDGTSPTEIAITENKQATTFLNVKIASKAGVVFKPALMKSAKIIK
jgi:ABC-type uncharacterized transport system substrate-binding protein